MRYSQSVKGSRSMFSPPLATDEQVAEYRRLSWELLQLKATDTSPVGMLFAAASEWRKARLASRDTSDDDWISRVDESNVNLTRAIEEWELAKSAEKAVDKRDAERERAGLAAPERSAEFLNWWNNHGHSLTYPIDIAEAAFVAAGQCGNAAGREQR
jgi:hypothetical protein